MREHVFIVCKLPHWGPDDTAYKGKLSKDDYKYQRKNINERFNNKQIREMMWEKNNAVIYAPRMNNALFEGIHFAPESQTQFIDQIIEMAARTICKFCCPLTIGRFKEEEMQMLWKENLICTGNKVKDPHEIHGKHNPAENIFDYRKGKSVELFQSRWETPIRGERWWENGQLDYRRPGYSQTLHKTT